jgi:hypothetical protein
MHRTLLPILALTLSMALPASSQTQAPWTNSMLRGHPLATEQPPLGFSHTVAGRFGVQMRRDAVSGAWRGEPLAELGYWLHWNHRTDNGWGFGLSVGVQAGNLWSQPGGLTARR